MRDMPVGTERARCRGESRARYPSGVSAPPQCRIELDAVAARARGAAGRWLRPRLEARVRRDLGPRREAIAGARSDLEGAASRLPLLRSRLAELRARAHVGPLTPDMTVHALLLAHPGAVAALAARGLPACGDCAVGADETLAEAARLEGFDLPALLAALSESVSA